MKHLFLPLLMVSVLGHDSKCDASVLSKVDEKSELLEPKDLCTLAWMQSLLLQNPFSSKSHAEKKDDRRELFVRCVQKRLQRDLSDEEVEHAGRLLQNAESVILQSFKDGAPLAPHVLDAVFNPLLKLPKQLKNNENNK